jgi:hypothetical protein
MPGKYRWIIFSYRKISERICRKIKKGILRSIPTFFRKTLFMGYWKIDCITRHDTKFNIICSCCLNDGQIRLQTQTQNLKNIIDVRVHPHDIYKTRARCAPISASNAPEDTQRFCENSGYYWYNVIFESSRRSLKELVTVLTLIDNFSNRLEKWQLFPHLPMPLLVLFKIFWVYNCS